MARYQGFICLSDMIVVVDEWSVVDKWWTKEPIRISWVVAVWYGRNVIFQKRKEDPVWRIQRKG
jgi:hypothetical protein